MGILIPIIVGVIGGIATALIRHYIQKHNKEEDLAPFKRQYNEWRCIWTSCMESILLF